MLKICPLLLSMFTECSIRNCHGHSCIDRCFQSKVNEGHLEYFFACPSSYSAFHTN